MIPSPCPSCGRESSKPIDFCPRCNYGFEDACPELIKELAKRHLIPSERFIEAMDLHAQALIEKFLKDLDKAMLEEQES